MDWTDIGVMTMEHPLPPVFNRAPPSFVPIQVKDVLHCFMGNAQAGSMTVLLAIQAFSGAQAVVVRSSP